MKQTCPRCNGPALAVRIGPNGAAYRERNLGFKAPEILDAIFPAGIPDPVMHCDHCGDTPITEAELYADEQEHGG